MGTFRIELDAVISNPKELSRKNVSINVDIEAEDRAHATRKLELALTRLVREWG